MRLTVARLEYWARADTLFNAESDQVNGKTKPYKSIFEGIFYN